MPRGVISCVIYFHVYAGVSLLDGQRVFVYVLYIYYVCVCDVIMSAAVCIALLVIKTCRYRLQLVPPAVGTACSWYRLQLVPPAVGTACSWYCWYKYLIGFSPDKAVQRDVCI